jgi:hypothetical protein
MSIQTEWLELIPGNNFRGAINFLDSLGWNITINRNEEIIKVYTGEPLLYKSSNNQEIEAFIFGMALSLAVLPGDILGRIREIIKE